MFAKISEFPLGGRVQRRRKAAKHDADRRADCRPDPAADTDVPLARLPRPPARSSAVGNRSPRPQSTSRGKNVCPDRRNSQRSPAGGPDDRLCAGRLEPAQARRTSYLLVRHPSSLH